MHENYRAYNSSHEELNEKLKNLAFSNNIEIVEKDLDTSPLIGLFGQAKEKVVDTQPITTKQIVKSGPVSLDGIFIKDDNVWGIVKNRNSSSSIIGPEQIISFNQSSITIETQSGIRSLHLKKDKKGINIRPVYIKQYTSDKKESKKQISRAEQIRLKLLKAARNNK